LTPFWFHQVEHWGKTARRSTLFQFHQQADGLRCWLLRLTVAMAAIPELLAGSAQLQSLPNALLQALEPLLERAPAGLFPRARRLYFDKYPLEGRPQDLDLEPAPGRFRTFVVRETLHQLVDPQDSRPAQPAANLQADLSTSKLHELAVVHWHQPDHAPLEAVSRYLLEQWQLHPVALEVMHESWFRQGGPWVRVTLPGADPAPVAVDPETTP
jgi:hypothetical protein